MLPLPAPVKLKALLVEVAIGLALIAALMGSVFYAGMQHTQAKWDIANLKTQQEIAMLKVKADAVTVKVETQYVTRDKVIVKKGDTITKYVPQYITPEEDKKCVIPNNFILLHDAAALNEVPPGGEDK